MTLPRSFAVIESDPEWGDFTPIEQARKRHRYMERRLAEVTSGTPEQLADFKQQLIEDTFRNAPAWQKPLQPKSLYPSAGEIPGEMLRLAGRLFTTPQQYYQSLYGAIGERPLDPYESIGKGLIRTGKRAIWEPIAHSFRYIIGEPEDVEKYPYTLYTDPLALYGVRSVPALAKYVRRKAPAVAARIGKQIPTIRKVVGRGEEILKGRVRPPGAQPIAGETAEAFNARVIAEEAAKREALKGRVRAVKSMEETVGRPKPLTPTPRGPYNRAMPKLTPHFPKQEAQKVADFVARHPDDVLSKEILLGKPLSPSAISEIERRIFNRMPTPVPPTGTRVKPPTLTEAPVNLNNPEELAKHLLRMGD